MNSFYRSLGAILEEDGSCTFRVWAPLKEDVHIQIVSPEPQKHAMHKDGYGYWHLTLQQVRVGTLYWIVLDEELRRPDPASASQPQGLHGPSEVVDRSFHWSDAHWRGRALEEMVIYELHVGAFTPEGSFKGIIDKLPYLKELGVNTIEIMPIGQFPGDRNWGYDVALPFAVQHSYGTVQEFKALVDAAHQADIAVVLDVIYNHVGPDGNYFEDFGPYFTDKYKTPWGKALNYDDAYSGGVRNYLIQNALTWLDEFHVDGLRIDAVHAIWDNSAFHIMEELKQEVAALEQSMGKNKILIAEIDLNNPRYINPAEKGGYGLDGQWVDEFYHALRAVLTGDRSGYYEDFGTMEHLEQAFKNTYVYNKVYSKHRKRVFGTAIEDNPYSQFIVFSQNHDQIGNRALGDRLNQNVNFEQLKLAAAAVLLSPYVPMLFMGEERAEESPFQFFVHHTDAELVAKVREGRKEEFAYFNFKEEFPDPQSEETFLRSKLSWSFESKEKAQIMLTYYKWLIAFRKTHPDMQQRDRKSTKVHAVSGNVLVFERFSAQGKLLVALNFGREKESVPATVCGACTKIFDSSDIEWAGPELVWFGALHLEESTFLNPLSATIYEYTNITKANDELSNIDI